MSTTDAIVCDFKNISPEEAFKKLIRTDENGKPALNVLIVDSDDPSSEFITCDNMNNYSGWQRLFYEMIAVDGDGNWALKVIQAEE